MSYQVHPDHEGIQHLIPFGDRIVILPIATEKESAHLDLNGGIDIDVRMSDGGVALPDEVDNEPIEGIVVALGDGVVFDLPWYIAEKIANRLLKTYRIAPQDGLLDPATVKSVAGELIDAAQTPIPFQVKIGDRVKWEPWSALSVVLEGRDYNIVQEEAILGVIEETPA